MSPATDPWGDRPDTGAGTRRAVGTAAWAALGLAIVSGVFGLPKASPDLHPPVALALVLSGVAAATAAGCLWHGGRHAHERGRGAAFAALFAGLLVFSLLLWPLAWGGDEIVPLGLRQVVHRV